MHYFKEWVACHDCDLLLRSGQISEKRQARCPRCSAVLYCHKPNSVDRTLAFSLAALLFYVPANVLPMMSLSIIGNTQSSTVLMGIARLWQQGYWWMALLVFICSMVVPLIELLLLILINGALKLNINYAFLPWITKWHRAISNWAMLDVYLLGLVVAIVKSGDIGQLVIEPGFYYFVLLLLLTLSALYNYDEHSVWNFVSKKNTAKNYCKNRAHVPV